MWGENTLSRRAILAGVSAATSSIVITEVAAQERDPTEYDRPLIIEKNGIETTFRDCSRVVIDSDHQSTITFISIGVGWTTPDNWVQNEEVDVENPELPFEYVVNCHLDEIGVENGAATIDYVNVWHDGADSPSHFPMPFGEWDCGEIRGQEVDPYVLENFC
ncbi:hypothetical protein BDK88_2843 [Natrinema hispanicum]|uniref:Uncharacterized protein n=1 Tax=Natrinema hispanicum TaxID=392421 RepID=A0A482Y4X1_9EURY|nr:hypothetical protein [Natrinema hispanicum]RZV08769.1 hypothetical protein BDK88_2843 [Natrinema hispanicum]